MNGYRGLQNVYIKQARRITPQRYDYRNSLSSPHAPQHRSKHRKHDPYLFNELRMRTREEMIEDFIVRHRDSDNAVQQIASMINGCFIALLDIRDLLTKKDI